MITHPTVTLLAWPTVSDTLMDRLPAVDPHDRDADLLGVYAGRRCYEAWDGARESTRSTEGYLANILKLGHESVLAHASFTFDIVGISRSLTHELVRSRFLAFSQISQRYVDSSEMDWVCPPRYRDDGFAQHALDAIWQQSLAAYRHLSTVPEGATTTQKKQAREAARSVLPNMTETRITVTGNVRAWRDFIRLRYTNGADVEIRELAEIVLTVLQREAPWSVQDLSWEALNG
jgi:thymidylate synthase (FAD)